MNEAIKELMQLCPGRIDIQLDYHKLFNETSKQVIEKSPNIYIASKSTLAKMKRLNTIVRVQANSKVEIVCYHFDLEQAINSVLKQVKEWERKS